MLKLQPSVFCNSTALTQCCVITCNESVLRDPSCKGSDSSSRCEHCAPAMTIKYPPNIRRLVCFILFLYSLPFTLGTSLYNASKVLDLVIADFFHQLVSQFKAAQQMLVAFYSWDKNLWCWINIEHYRNILNGTFILGISLLLLASVKSILDHYVS